MEIKQLQNILEAALLAAPHPQSLPQLSALFSDEDSVSQDDVARALDALREACDGRGVELLEVASGYRYQVRQDVHPWVARLWTERPSRYSRALLETLALIAYRQPITRGEIEQIRGVVVSTNIIKTLEEREWIRVVGHRDAPGKPALFGTTRGFLDYFNLKSLDELPALAEIRDFEDADPQLNFGGEGNTPARAALPDADTAEATLDTHADAGPDDTHRDPAPDVSMQTDIATVEDGDQALQERTDGAPNEPTADEAESPADVEPAAATQDTQETRA